MKKFLSIFICLILALSFAGCAKTPEEGNKEPSDNPSDNPVREFDTKNYYIVGSFTGWEMQYSEDMKFTRLSTQDDEGFTLYTKEIELKDDCQFKIVNDGDPSSYYSNEMNFNSLKGGTAAEYFG